MSDRNLFEIASRSKFRFPTSKGSVSVEDLWDMPLNGRSAYCLNNVAKSVNAVLKQEQEEDFVSDRTSTDQETIDMMDIIKHVIAVRKAEAKSELDAKKRRDQKQKIAEIIESKKDAEYQNMSLEELQELHKTL